MITDRILSALPLKVRLKLAYLRVAGTPRSSYKETWNGVSTDSELARIGVAGFAERQKFFSSGESSAKSISELLALTNEHVVLEIGCGVGRIGRALAPRCKQWIGCDISQKMLDLAQTELFDLPNTSFVELESCDLAPISDQSVDRVYCSAVFMHLDEWDRFAYVKEAYRVLRDEGVCYFDNLNLAGDTGWKIFEDISKISPLRRPPNISKTSTAEELTTYLKRANFQNVKAYPGEHFVAVVGTKST